MQVHSAKSIHELSMPVHTGIVWNELMCQHSVPFRFILSTHTHTTQFHTI